MTKQEAKAAWIRGVLALLTLILFVGLAVLFGLFLPADQGREAPTSPKSALTDDEEFRIKLKFVMNQLTIQSETEKSIRAELDNGDYSFDQPLVVVNPYGISPLTAVAIFHTELPVRISVHVPGKCQITDVDFTFSEFATEHVVPIYGLYAGKVNPVVLTSQTKDGTRQKTTLEIETESLKNSIAQIILIADTAQPEQYQPGLNFTYEARAAFDANGDFRWYLNGDYRSFLNDEYAQGHFMMVLGSSYDEGSVIFLEIDPLGKIYKAFYSPYACHHDIQPYSGGNLLVTGSEGETTEDLIYEINPETGEIVNKLDLKTIFARVRKGLTAPENPDWLHLNAIDWVRGSSDIVISSRNQSLVARISWPDGAIRWMLSDHRDWPEMYQKYLLTPVGEGFEWPYNQHAPYILPDQDNNPDTIDLLVYDNGNQRLEMNGDDTGELYTRLVHYQIDEKLMTVSQIRQYGKELGDALYASSRGNVEPAENGDLIASYCISSGETYWVEYREIDANSQLVWQTVAFNKSRTGELLEYRVKRMQIYNDGSNTSILDNDAINMIPSEVLMQYEIN